MMQNQQLRENLAAELKRQKLPPSYVERLLAEWDDHLADLQDERNANMNTARTSESNPNELQTTHIIDLQQRLGDPTQLATFAEQTYRRRSFLGRHPIFTFLFAPLPLLLLSWIAILSPFFMIGFVLDSIGAQTGEPRDYPYLAALGIALWSWLIMAIAPLTTMLWLCRIARRNALKWRWAVTANGLVATACAVLWAWGKQATNDHYIPNSPGNGCFMFGINLPTSLRDAPLFLAKFAIAVFVGLLLVRRAQRLQNLEECKSEAAPLRRAA
jgi:hypothetical protein